jgi:hypothetical protein
MDQVSQRYNLAVVYASYDSQIVSLTNLIHISSVSEKMAGEQAYRAPETAREHVLLENLKIRDFERQKKLIRD